MELRQAALELMEGAPVDRAELLKREEALTLEAAERNLDLEQLETRERLVARAEDEVAAREAWAQEEVDRRVAEARSAFEREYETRLGRIKAEAEGRTAALRAKLAEVTRRADSSAAALSAAQAELSSSRAEQLLLQQRVDTPRPSRSRMRTRSVGGGFWSRSMPHASNAQRKGQHNFGQHLRDCR